MHKLADDCENKEFLQKFIEKVELIEDNIRDFQVSQCLECIRDFDWFPELKARLIGNIFLNNPVFDDTILQKDFRMGPLVFVTPEYKGISKAGGISVMMVDLCERLVELGEEVIVITPYYNIDRNGHENYLQTEYKFNVYVDMERRHEFGIHYKEINGVKIYLLHSAEIFPKVYPSVKIYLI